MKRLLPFVVLLSIFCFITVSHGFPQKGQQCSKCHTLKKDEAQAILKKFAPNIKVLNIRTGPVKYLWEVDVDTNGKKGVVYIDLPKKNIFSGTLIAIQEKKNLTQDRLSELNKVNVAQIPVQDALVLGDRNAKHRVIVFDDPD
jgi:thiol:disulfide interchange protein DsbC